MRTNVQDLRFCTLQKAVYVRSVLCELCMPLRERTKMIDLRAGLFYAAEGEEITLKFFKVLKHQPPNR